MQGRRERKVPRSREVWSRPVGDFSYLFLTLFEVVFNLQLGGCVSCGVRYMSTCTLPAREVVFAWYPLLVCDTCSLALIKLINTFSKSSSNSVTTCIIKILILIDSNSSVTRYFVN